jgi:Helix-turn-helix domain
MRGDGLETAMNDLMKVTVWPRYLTNREAASFLHLSPRTLEKHRMFGIGPRFYKFGGKVIYDMADIEAWIAARAFAETAGSR